MGQIKCHRKKIIFLLSLLGIVTSYLIFHGKYFCLRDGKDLSPAFACQPPDLPANIDATSNFFGTYDPLTCLDEDDWVRVDGSEATISRKVKRKFGSISCQFTELVRIDDDTVGIGRSSKSNSTFIFNTSDFYLTDCSASRERRWKNVLVGIRRDENILYERRWDKVPVDSVAVNVLMLAINSMSQSDFMRILPKTYSFLTGNLQATVLRGYNIVGDGTLQALIPILTGQTEHELPETRRFMGEGAQHVDAYPFIWNSFRNAGYVTLFAEDQPHIGTFNYGLKGFLEPPTDHYMRTFYNYIFPMYSQYPNLCFKSTPRHRVFFDYFANFFTAYSTHPKFAFGMYSELSHSDHNLMAVADADLLSLIKALKDKGHLDNTVMVVFSDHVRRFGGVRGGPLDKQEDWMPFFSIYVPPKFKLAHPSAADNIRVNAHRLSTPFDVHSTLRDLLKFSGAKLGSVENRGISLFSQIPSSRTCFHAFIEPHWCACFTWETMLPTEDKVKEAAEALVHYINSFTSSQRAYCRLLEVASIDWAAILSPNEAVIHFRKNLGTDGFLPDLSAQTYLSREVYQLGVTVQPQDSTFFRTPSGLLMFEASLTYNIKQDSFSVKIADVRRTNRYEEHSHCILKKYPELHKFCYCIHAPG